MARPRGKKLRLVGVSRRTARKKRPGADGEVGNGEPLTAQRVIAFPKPRAAEDVVSERIIFEIGGDRFAIQWTAEIERLPPAGPVVVE